MTRPDVDIAAAIEPSDEEVIARARWILDVNATAYVDEDTLRFARVIIALADERATVEQRAVEAVAFALDGEVSDRVFDMVKRYVQTGEWKP